MSTANEFKVLYFGLLAERRGLAEEKIRSSAMDAAGLYAELNAAHGLGLSVENFRVAVNDEFATWDSAIGSGDVVAFLPPMSGG